MRSSYLRLASVAVLFMFFAWLMTWGDKTLRGQPAGIAKAKGDKKGDKEKEKKEDRPADEDNLPFSFPYERDAKNQLIAARDYLNFKQEIHWNTVCPLLQNILEAKSDSFFNNTYTVGARFKLTEQSFVTLLKDKKLPESVQSKLNPLKDKEFSRDEFVGEIDKLLNADEKKQFQSLILNHATVGGTKEVLRISVKTEANQIIAAFPPEGLQFYQQLYGQTASSLLDEAIKANYDIPMLADLSQKYFHTKAGAEATILLGTLHLERGNYLEAAYAFERILGRPAVEDLLTTRTLFKACLAFKRCGDQKYQELLKTTLASLQTATVKDGLALGRKNYTFDQLKTEIYRPLELIRVSSAVGEWAMRGGNPARSGTIEGGAPFLDPIFRSTMFYSDGSEDEEAISTIKDELQKLFNRENSDSKARKIVPLPSFFPVTTPDLVMFRTYKGVYAVATRDQVVNGRVVRAGELRWSSKTLAGAHQLFTLEQDQADAKQSVTQWWNTYTQTGVTSILYENPLIGALSHDDQNVYYVDDIAIPPPPVYSFPEFGINTNPGQQYRQSGRLAEAVRAGRLLAVNMRTGCMTWDLGRVIKDTYEPQGAGGPALPNCLNEDEADKSTSAFQLCLDAVFLGAPLPLNDKLYVLVEQAGVVRLLCLDPRNLSVVPGQPRKPTLVWSQKLGRAKDMLPQDSIRRYQGITLAESEGIIICPTNSGAIVAVDSRSHSLLWAHAYRKVENNSPNIRQPNFTPDGRPVLPIQLPVDRWRAAGPIISNGRVILTAYDSNKLECLELRSGKVVWSVPRETNDLYVGGIVNEKVVVVGKNQIRAYELGGDPENHGPKLAFDHVDIPTPTGHGIGGKGVFYIPVRQDNAGTNMIPSAEIWAVNVENGTIVSKTVARRRDDNVELAKFGLGNLVFQDGLVFAQSAWEISCFPQLEQKKAEMDRLLKANPKDPVGLLNRGELLLDDGKLKDAIADFQEAEKNNLPEEKKSTLRDKKYAAYTELLKADFELGEQYLNEYKALCEIAADVNETAEDKVRREDEIGRRQRWREFLIAKGREKQGRLGEAFDHYIALSNMGEAKNLIEMPEEPNVRTRPDVWARGRIESMIRRAKDDAARKSLEDRVIKEWDNVKDTNDLKRIRDFVAIFGPYFKVGAGAQFILVDKLLATNNEVDAREAQTYLAQIRATADEPADRARATEALARFMVKSQLMEDAVGLYLQLGKEYPNVVIRDGKTGNDYTTLLLTDKRLLPYLEPSRYPMPTRVKAEQREGVPGGNFGAQFEIEPSGELFPMYKRYRFSIDQFVSGDGTWTVRAFDRSTGVERCRFTRLNPPQIYNPGSIPFSKFVQGNGQLLLVQLGSWMYCLDLAEKKERWQKNLLDDAAAGAAANPPITNPDADGDIVVKYAEGYIITLGKAAVLQPGYAALLTRDGLEVVEPLTRKLLWIRRGIQQRTQLYGDAQYLVLLETDIYKKPVGTKVLRATDGVQVEGSPDSGRILAAAKSFQIMGKNALLVEGTGDQPRVLRLIDLTTGKDVWKKEYEAKAVPIKSMGSEFCGFIKPNGVAEVIESRTGRTLATLKIDEENWETDLKPCIAGQLFADSDRFFLFLDRDPSTPSSSGTLRQPVYNNSIRTHAINGPLYAFDRITGKRLWSYGDGLGILENQMLILEQFSELPVIIFAGPMQTQNNRQFSYPVVVLEKARGRLLLNRTIPYNENFFHNINVNAKNGIIELNRFDLRIVISPDETPSAK